MMMHTLLVAYLVLLIFLKDEYVGLRYIGSISRSGPGRVLKNGQKENLNRNVFKNINYVLTDKTILDEFDLNRFKVYSLAHFIVCDDYVSLIYQLLFII